METFSWYKGYGINYRTISGTTSVQSNGETIAQFPGLGELAGNKAAKAWIDDHLV